MKKPMHRALTPRAARNHGLRLSQETIRVLHPEDLSRAISGCDVTSVTPTSTGHTQKASNNGCIDRD